MKRLFYLVFLFFVTSIKAQDVLFYSGNSVSAVDASDVDSVIFTPPQTVSSCYLQLHSKWKGKKVGFLGDSITEQGEYVDAYQTLSGCIALNYGISGTTIAGDYPNAMCKRFKIQLSDDLDMVVVLGGVNDFQGSGHSFPMGSFINANLDGSLDVTFYGALHTLMRGLREKYQSIPIVFLTPLHCQYSGRGEYDESIFNENGTLVEKKYPLNDGTDSIGSSLKNFVNAIKEVAVLYSIIVIDTYAISGISPLIPGNKSLYTKDGLHLNTKGGERLAKTIYPVLESLM